MDCLEISQRFDDRLDIADYAPIDPSENGLQVGPEDRTVEHVAVAVDAALEPIERAAEAGADLLVVHHGLLWGDADRLTGNHYQRIAGLIDHDLALYAVHLPLDGHQNLGNAAGLADILDLGNRAPFGELGDEYVGQRGRATKPFSVEELSEHLQAELDVGDGSVRVLDFGPDEIADVAVVTGSGTDWIEDAARKGVDALVTGEGKGKAYHLAKEFDLHVFLAGHYATETFGVRALAALAEEWGLETTFIDCPTGL